MVYDKGSFQLKTMSSDTINRKLRPPRPVLYLLKSNMPESRLTIEAEYSCIAYRVGYLEDGLGGGGDGIGCLLPDHRRYHQLLNNSLIP